MLDPCDSVPAAGELLALDVKEPPPPGGTLILTWRPDPEDAWERALLDDVVCRSSPREAIGCRLL